MKQISAENDVRFMRRAIELARHGLGNTSPNPMVGAVIVHDGLIIGEGYHRKCGEGHAEVNAVASVRDRNRLKESTIYVTLEPCSHYGKTPPCAKLIIDCGIPRVVVGSLDPFEKVSGRGIKMLRDAGIEVVTGVLEEECRRINTVFMTAHTLHRPYVTLKWAQSSDGFIDRERTSEDKPTQFSTPLTFALSHRLRTINDAIMVGSGTVGADNPSLTPRRWPGKAPLRVIADRSGSLSPTCRVLTDDMPTIVVGATDGSRDIGNYLSTLYGRGVTSLLVEGGSRLLQSFINEGLWDAARIEVSPITLGSGVRAPQIESIPQRMLKIEGNELIYYRNSPY